MKEIILIKLGEMVLKGLNRRTFEDVLKKNIRKKLRPLGEFNLKCAQSTIYIEPLNNNIDLEKVMDELKKVFGIATLSRAGVTEKNMQSIKKAAVSYLHDILANASTFKVEAKRSDKAFPLKSPQICYEVGGFILNHFPNLTVNVKNPDVTVTVEIRDFNAYIRSDFVKGAAGMPVSTGGKAAILISGGIDSPVAAWMMAKRGVSLTAIHFASPPYTSERSEKKVCDLLSKVSEYSGQIKLYTVNFTNIQECIHDNCPEELITIIMRRLMMIIAEKIAKNNDCDALITGESLGQVASQTIKAIACTDSVVNMPVFRPLIGMDKDEIVTLSRKIDTFNISIQPFEDCCTVFVPKHPRTRPILKYVDKAQNSINWEPMINDCLNNVKISKIGF